MSLVWFALFNRCRRAFLAVPVAAGLGLAACTWSPAGMPNAHYTDIKVALPKGNRIEVCSAYQCARRTPFTFTKADLQQIAQAMNRTVKADTPAEERKGIAQAVAWVETRVGRQVGTWRDRPGSNPRYAGDPSQMDSFDEATNTTSTLLIMETYGLLRHHTVERPTSRGLSFGARAYAAVIVEKKKRHRFIVDSSIEANGKPPHILPIERW